LITTIIAFSFPKLSLPRLGAQPQTCSNDMGDGLCGLDAVEKPDIQELKTVSAPPERSAASPAGEPERKRFIQMVSWEPRALIYHNFLTPEEVKHIKQLAVTMMRRSTVVGPNGTTVLDDYRTSYGTFIKRKFDPVITRIENRIAEWTKIPAVHQEDMQVLRYGIGQEYKVHMDTLSDDAAGPRIATVLMYLNDPEEGGETIFPYSKNWIRKEVPEALGKVSPCAEGVVGTKPKEGDALMFWSIDPDGKTEDYLSSHTACPVLKGFKWAAPKWVHARPFRPATYDAEDPYDQDPGLCTDLDERCPDWAKAGECESNNAFMAGNESNPGRCRKSCGACKTCAKGDRECYMENRRQAGYLVYDPAEVGMDKLPIDQM